MAATQCELITRIPYYPSWIEIPVHDLERATAIYRTVFGLDRTPRYQALGADVVVLLASDKDARAPGVALVKSRLHTLSLHGPVVNFHVGTHAALMAAVEEVVRHGGGLASRLFDAGDGTRVQHVRDREGNTLALSSGSCPRGRSRRRSRDWRHELYIRLRWPTCLRERRWHP